MGRRKKGKRKRMTVCIWQVLFEKVLAALTISLGCRWWWCCTMYLVSTDCYFMYIFLGIDRVRDCIFLSIMIHIFALEIDLAGSETGGRRGRGG